MKYLKTTIRKIGNAQGVIIPKPILEQVGLVGEAAMTVENGSLVLRKLKRHARQNWAEASKKIAAEGDDTPVWPEFANEGDENLVW
jgi:antitoxin MazE